MGQEARAFTVKKFADENFAIKYTKAGLLSMAKGKSGMRICSP